MKSFLMLLTLTTSTALAAQPDCKTLLLTSTNLSYSTQATFPNTPEEKELKFLDEEEPAGPQKLCGLTFTPDRKAGSLKISANTFAAFTPMLGRLAPSTAKTRLSLDNTFSTGSAMTLEEQHLYFDPKGRTISYQAKPNYGIKTTAGIKIDGGPLQPLWFNNKATPVTYPATAKTLDIYLKTDNGGDLFWKRVTINLKSPSFTIYEQATMPSK